MNKDELTQPAAVTPRQTLVTTEEAEGKSKAAARTNKIRGEGESERQTKGFQTHDLRRGKGNG